MELRGRGTNHGHCWDFLLGKELWHNEPTLGWNDPFQNCGWEGGVWRQVLSVLGWGCPVPQGFVPILGFQQLEGLGRGAPASRKHHLCSALLLPPGTTMRKRMVKDLSNSGLEKSGKSPPRSSLTFMPGSALPWLCPWASPVCAGTSGLSWVPPGPPVQQQGEESLGQNESLGAAFPWFIHIPGILVRWL